MLTKKFYVSRLGIVIYFFLDEFVLFYHLKVY